MSHKVSSETMFTQDAKAGCMEKENTFLRKARSVGKNGRKHGQEVQSVEALDGCISGTLQT
jgi:hypothetical protein